MDSQVKPAKSSEGKSSEARHVRSRSCQMHFVVRKDAGRKRKKPVARKWNEANCRSRRRARFLQRSAFPARNRGQGNQKPLIRRGLREHGTGTRWQRDCR